MYFLQDPAQNKYNEIKTKVDEPLVLGQAACFLQYRISTDTVIAWKRNLPHLGVVFAFTGLFHS